MQTEQDLQRQRARSGMTGTDDAHRRLVAAVESAARKCGIKSDAAVHAVVGAIMADRLAALEPDGSVSWRGEHGWDLASAMPGYLASPELRPIRERDRELAGEPSTSQADLRRDIGERLMAALAPPAQSDWTREAIGKALAQNL